MCDGWVVGGGRDGRVKGSEEENLNRVYHGMDVWQ